MGREQGVVIGAGPGMGRSMALEMARHGLAVTLVGRDGAALEGLRAEVAATVGDDAGSVVVPADAGDPEAMAAVVAGCLSRGDLRVIAYNAAAAGGPLLDAAPAELRTSLAVNALSLVSAVRAASDSLERTAGRVLVTGGGLALKPSAAAGVLSLGKAALRTTTLLLAQEMAPRGVAVRTLVVAGTIGGSDAFAPDRIAAALWAMGDSAEVERVYTGVS